MYKILQKIVLDVGSLDVRNKQRGDIYKQAKPWLLEYFYQTKQNLLKGTSEGCPGKRFLRSLEITN